MAANILDVWSSDRAAMALAAREHVEGRFSWDRTFQALFGEVYPRAIEARAELTAGTAAAFARSPAA
jgi:alpha-1,6-mannosyltransferase